MDKPRLIDANEWIKELRINPAANVLDRFVNERIICLLEKRPTAYDIDKAVEQLSEIEVHRNEYSETVECNIEPCRGMSCYECILDKAIEIVKGNYSENPNSLKGGVVDDETMA